MRIYLDDTEYTAINAEDFIISIIHDYDSRFFFKSFPVNLTFAGAGFDYLKSLLDDFCRTVDVRIEIDCESGTRSFDGIIRLIDTVVDCTKCTIDVPVIESGFEQMIRNYKDVEVCLSSTRSVLGNDITPPEINQLTTGIKQVNGNLLNDVLQYMFDFMSDGTLCYESPLFGEGGEFECLFLTDGLNLSEGILASRTPCFSFQDLWDCLVKIFNVALVVCEVDGRQCAIVDYIDNFKSTDVVLDLQPFDGTLIDRFDVDRVPAKIQIGQDEDCELASTDPNFFPDIDWIGWRSEEYYSLSDCSSDAVLDLQYSCKTHHNCIYHALNQDENDPERNKDLDDCLFLVDAERNGSVCSLRRTDILGTGQLYLNERLNNCAIGERWFTFIPNDIANYLGDGNDEFCATSNSDSFNSDYPFTVFDFPNEQSDPNNNYDPLTSEYTVPSDGCYTFLHRACLVFQQFGDGPMDVDSSLIVNGISVQTQNDQINTNPNGTYTHDFTYTVCLQQNDKVRIGMELTDNSNTNLSSGFICPMEFKVISTVNGGGVYQTGNPAEAQAFLHDMQAQVKCEDFFNVCDCPDRFGLLDWQKRKGWIERIDFNPTQCVATILTNSNRTANV